MFENTAITKIFGGGCVTIAAAGCGCYLYIQNEKWKNFTGEHPDYLIVKSTAITEKDSNNDLTKKLNNNFKCKFSDNFDEKCQIFSLSDDNKKLTESLNNAKIESVQKNSIKEANNYFRLIASKKIMDAITKWDDSNELIEIVKKDKDSTSNHIFAKFQPIYRVQDGKITKRKTSFVMTKVENDGTTITQPGDDMVNGYQCGFTNSSTDEKFDCELSEITFSSSNNTYIVDESENKALAKDNLKTLNKNFQIKLTQEHLDKIFNRGEAKKIYVFPKNLSNKNEDKIFAKLTPQFKKLDQKITGQDKFFLTLVASTSVDVDGKNFSNSTCKINSDPLALPCSIFSFTNEQSTTTVTDVKQMNVGKTLTAITDASKIKKNHYFAIKLNNSNKQIPNETNITLTSTDSPTKSYSFTVKSNIYLDATLTEQTYTVNGAYILQ